MNNPTHPQAFGELVDQLHRLQQRRCGICGDQDDRLVVDHDHDNGMVRGLLCGSCNTNEGRHHCDQSTFHCPTCAWRAMPAVVHLGWTTQYAPPRAANEWYTVGEFRTATEIVERVEAGGRAVADAVATALGFDEAYSRRRNELAPARKADQ